MTREVQFSVRGDETEARQVNTIFCVGKNYLQHVQEMQSKLPDAPVIFSKPNSALVTSDEVLQFPLEKGVAHHEVEIVLYISKPGKRIKKEDVWDHIGGYTVGIDFTLRQLQSDLKQKGFPWLLSKGFDQSAAITTFYPIPSRDEVNKTKFWLKLNGKERQSATIDEMVFDIPTLIAFLSRTITLQEGDLIYTGTPAGVGQVQTHDEITLGIDGLVEDTFVVG